MRIMCLFLSLFFAFACVTHAQTNSYQASKPGAPQGALVSFKGKAELNLKLRDDIHAALRTKVIYRAKNVFVDQVDLKNKGNISSYAKLCDEYKKYEVVKGCDVLLNNPPPEARTELRSKTEARVCNNCSNGPPEQILNLVAIVQAIEKNKCDLVDEKGFSHSTPGLSPFWAQQQIGSDLVNDEIDGVNPKKQTTHSILDGGFDRHLMRGSVAPNFPSGRFGGWAHHGVYTANLLNAKDPHGIDRRAKIVSAVDAYSNNFLEAMDKLIDNPQEDIATLEMHSLCELSNCGRAQFGNRGSVIREVIGTLSKKTIVVAPAGNFYPLGSADSVVGSSNLIVVGSSNSSGLISSFSDESNDVSVLAPTKEGVLVHDINGTVTGFGGTSAAGPLTSGSLSHAVSVLGELNQAEAKLILEKSATKNPVTDISPQKNGKGILNDYKMFRVALRLREKGWPKNREQLLLDSSIFDFTNEAATMIQDAKALVATDKCENVNKAFILARKSFLLSPSADSANILAQLYESQGYYMDASFYRNHDAKTMLSQLKNVVGNTPPNVVQNESATKQIDYEDARRSLRLLQSRK